MQTLFEGMAVGIMDLMRRECRNPLLTEMIRRIEQDESRHAAFGVLTMRRVVRDAAPEQMAEMEDWAFGILEALNANQQLDMLRLLGPKYGIDPEAVVKMVDGAAELRRAQQPRLHAHGGAEPAQPRPDHRAHARSLEAARHADRRRAPRARRSASRRR